MNKTLWLFQVGVEYSKAFLILSNTQEIQLAKWWVINRADTIGVIEKPTYYCSAFAIECFLKSFLRLQKMQYLENSKSHDLSKLLNLRLESLKTFFGFTDENLASIKLLNQRYYDDEHYGKYDLRYPQKSGTRISPHPDDLSVVLQKMESRLKLAVLNRNRS